MKRILLLTLVLCLGVQLGFAQTRSVPMTADNFSVAYSGQVTEEPDGLKVQTVGYRNGNLFFNKDVFNSIGKEVRFKWFLKNTGSYIRGYFKLAQTSVASGDIQNFRGALNQWLYTTVTVNPDYTFSVVTRSEGYSGTVVDSNSGTVTDPNEQALLENTNFRFYFWDTYDSNAYLTLGELIIPDNSPQQLYEISNIDFEDQTIPSDITISGSTNSIATDGANSMYSLFLDGSPDDYVEFAVSDPEVDMLTFNVKLNHAESFSIMTSVNGVNLFWLSVYHDGSTSYVPEWCEVAVPVVGAEPVRITFYTDPNQDLYIDNIRQYKLNSPPSSQALSNNSVDENSAKGTIIGQLSGTDPDGDPISYSLTDNSETNNEWFSIDASNNLITNAYLDFEEFAQLNVEVAASDQICDQNLLQTYDIFVNDLSDYPQIDQGQTFSVDENTSAATILGDVTSNANSGDIPEYSIADDFGAGFFSIEKATGELSLLAGAELDYEKQSQYPLCIRLFNAAPAMEETTYSNVYVNLQNVDEPPVFDYDNIPVLEISLPEDVQVGDVIYTVPAFDEDAGEDPVFSIASGNTNNYLSINSATGEIAVVNTGFDFEDDTADPISLEIQLTDADNSSLFNTETFGVVVNDVDEAPVVDAGQTYSVDENSAASTSVGTVTASDEDAGDDTWNYSITGGNSAGFFGIDGASGALMVAQSGLDYEATASYNLTIQVADASDNTLTSEETVTVNINDIDEAPVVDASQTFSVDENSAASTSVGTVIAIDEDAGDDTWSYSITGGNSAGFFAIDGASGALTVAQSGLDYEATASYNLTIQVADASDNTLTTQETVTVNINDVDEAPVVDAGQTFSVDENSVAGTSVGTVLASDEDEGDDNWSYAITSGNNGPFFEIDAATGELTVAMDGLDYEFFGNIFSLTIQVADASDNTLKSEEIVTVNVNDVNEAPVIFANQSFDVDENSLVATVVGTVSFNDQDSGDSHSFSIISGNADGLFAIGASDGTISVAQEGLDFESTQSFVLTVEVSDGTLTDQADVTVTVNNLNDNTPVLVNGSNTVDEHTSAGTQVYALDATDADGALNNLIYSIVTGHSAIGLNGDVLEVADASLLDFEDLESITITVQVSDGTNSSTGDITVNLKNINDNAPELSSDVVSLAERADNGTVVYTLAPADADGTLNELTIYPVSGHNALDLNANNEIVVVDGTLLDYETDPQITIEAYVSDGTFSSANAALTINLTDVDDDSPSITIQPEDGQVCESKSVEVALVADGHGTLSYDWKKDGVSLGIENANIANIPWADIDETSAYTCVVTSEYGTTESQSFGISINPNPVINIGPDDVITTTESKTLDAGSGFESYNWSYSGNTPEGQIITINGSDIGIGEYLVSVDVIDVNGCKGTDEMNLTVSTATEISDKHEVSTVVYPNPAEDYVFVSIKGIGAPDFIQLVSMTGQVVDCNCQKVSDNSYRIDLNGIKSGIYFLNISSGAMKKIEKIMVR